VVIPTIIQIDATLLNVFSVSLVSWIPAINASTTMWIIKPYRRAIKRVFIKNSQNAGVNNVFSTRH
jgi:hypothetical protein